MPLRRSHAESSHFGVLEFAAFGLLEKLHVFQIGAGPAAFNVMNPERIELLGNAQFIGRRKSQCAPA